MSDFFWKIWSVLVYARQFGSFGRRTWIRKPLVIHDPKHISIGSGCFIRDGARLEVVSRKGLAPGRIDIGNNVTMEQGVHIVACTSVVIEDEACFAPRCTIVDTTHPIEGAEEGNRARQVSNEPSFVHIGKRVFLGANVVVLTNVRIGENSVIGANSVVTRDIPANSIAVGSPARVIKTIR
jgi:acetyltransferase-like isoleucine patch superfamily enzyme